MSIQPELAELTRSPIVIRTLLHTRPGQWPTSDRVHEMISLTTTRANGCSGPSVGISWVRLGGFMLGETSEPVMITPRVEMFSDTWLAFTELRDVFEVLAGFDSHVVGERATADAVKAALLAIGFVESEFSHE